MITTLQKWQNLFLSKITPVEIINTFKGVNILIKRDDLNHDIVQGNKLRKLKYNVKFAIENNYNTLATFGGAWSNHIVATAQAANLCGINCIGFIRGEELLNKQYKWSATLKQAEKFGMNLVFLSRQEYRLKHNSKIVKQHIKNISTYLVPEGGSNQLALKGVAEIINELKQQIKTPTHIITACGTGGTLAGLINGVAEHGWDTEVIGIPVLKGAEFLEKEVSEFVKSNKSNWKMFFDYHAGGYAKSSQIIVDFGNKFVNDTGIDLDKIYTSKSFFAAFDLIEKGHIKAGSNIVILHTGGLQGGLITDC